MFRLREVRVWSFTPASLLLLLASCASGNSHGAQSREMAMSGARLPGACEAPSASKDGSIGCYFDTSLELSSLPSPVYWHIYEHPDRASAEAARDASGVVVTAYSRTFLYRVDGEARPTRLRGRHLASVGPLATTSGGRVTARFMQATTKPGAKTRVHTHAGPEAFYLLSGAICMDSPSGAAITRAGATYSIGEDIPMQLHHSGSEVRRSIFMVLHPTSEPWMEMSDWQPTGRCTH